MCVDWVSFSSCAILELSTSNKRDFFCRSWKVWEEL